MSEGARLVASAVLLSLWIGAGLLFVAVVAPSAFAVLPSRTLAGALVGRVLPVVFVAGIVVGIVVAVLAAAGGRLALARAVLGAAVAVGCGVAHFWIGGRIGALRASIGPSLELLDPADPRRVLFGRLHALSVAGLGAAGLAAVIALTLTLVALRPRG